MTRKPSHGAPARIRTGREVQITGPGLLYDGEVIRTAVMDPDCYECEALHDRADRAEARCAKLEAEVKRLRRALSPCMYGCSAAAHSVDDEELRDCTYCDCARYECAEGVRP